MELFKGRHDFSASGGDTFKGFLFASTTSSTHGAGSELFSEVTSNADEASGTGYTTGGAALTNVEPDSSSTIAYTDFDDLTWSSSTVSASGFGIYNDTNGDRMVSVHDFGTTVSSSNGDFTIVFPTGNSTSAIYRLA